MLTTDPFDDDKLREECGIFGVTDAEGASAMVAQWAMLRVISTVKKSSAV